MTQDDNPPPCKYFNLTYPLPFVAHVEIDRPEKMNAFTDEQVPHRYRTIFVEITANTN